MSETPGSDHGGAPLTRRRFLAKTVGAGATLGLAPTLLAACGGASGPEGKDDKNVLTLWHMEEPPNRVKAFQEVIDRYNATDPKYRVKQQVQNWDEIYSKIASSIQSGNQPDVLFTIPDFTTYVRTLGSVRPVSKKVEGLDAGHGFSDVATAPYRDKGEHWAIPLYGMVQVLWYRKDLLDEAGVEPPKSWDDLLTAAKQLDAGKTSGIALPAGRNLATDQVVYSFMVTNGAANFFTDDGGIDFDKPEVVESFDFYNQLLKYSPSDSGSYSWGEPQAALNSGAAAMAIEKGQYLAPFEEESGRPTDDLGCVPIPQPDGGQPGSIYYSNGAMILSDDDERAAAAEDFLSFILKPDNYGDFLNAEPGLFLPLTEDGREAESWTQHKTIKKYSHCVDVMLKQAESGELFGFVDGQYIDTVGEISGQNIIAQVIQRMHSSGHSPAKAVAWGAEQMQDAVR
ncbi:MAG: extracellular solute-binding protein [Streptosporangiales bacterium]|nr:extracellular solute-binding protein [Streptosporangiales bacterium]